MTVELFVFLCISSGGVGDCVEPSFKVNFGTTEATLEDGVLAVVVGGAGADSCSLPDEEFMDGGEDFCFFSPPPLSGWADVEIC